MDGTKFWWLPWVPAKSKSCQLTWAPLYSEIEKHVGLLSHLETNRREAKNGQHKRKVKIGNNSINVTKTIMNNDNEMGAVLKHFGWFKTETLSIVKLSDEIKTSEPYHEAIVRNVKKEEFVVAEKILYKNTEYACGEHTSILVHETAKRSSFMFGILTKIILKKSSQSEILACV